MKDLLLIVYLIIVLAVNGYSQAGSEEDLFNQGIELYQQGSYEESLIMFESLVKGGHASSSLFYNLANCHSKLDQTAQTVLYYERALKLSPHDKDIKHNLQLATQEINDEIIPVPDFYLLQKWEDFASLMKSNYWSYLYIALLAVVLYFVYNWLFGKTRKDRKRGFYLAGVVFLIAIICFWASRTKYQLEYSNDTAVVMLEDLYLKSGPNIKSTDQRLLFAGVRVEITDQIGGWYKVTLANNEVGWIEMKNLEII